MTTAPPRQTNNNVFRNVTSLEQSFFLHRITSSLEVSEIFSYPVTIISWNVQFYDVVYFCE